MDEHELPPPLPPFPPRPRARRRLASTAVVGGALAVGGVVGAIIGAPLISSAQNDDVSTETTDSDGASDDVDDSDTTGEDDAITGEDEGVGNDDEICLPKPGMLGRHMIVGPWLDAAAEALDLGTAELRDLLRDGDSLADVAGEQGVEVEELVDAIIADAERMLDEQVDAGRIGADEADERKEELAEWVAEFVDGDWPSMERPERRMHRADRPGVLDDVHEGVDGSWPGRWGNPAADAFHEMVVEW